MAKRVPKILEEDCIACGNCQEVCPEVFRLNENLGHSEVINPQGAPEEKIQEALDQCPAQCIHWADEM
ncbi:MAG: ferredoxin [Deltaproteobacteria bacterium RBG_13_60_28]|nr:MAG: ferredoxin [Deltaproteobacteria bacterium RBG_13_60_28]